MIQGYKMFFYNWSDAKQIEIFEDSKWMNSRTESTASGGLDWTRFVQRDKKVSRFDLNRKVVNIINTALRIKYEVED